MEYLHTGDRQIIEELNELHEELGRQGMFPWCIEHRVVVSYLPIWVIGACQRHNEKF